MKKANYTHKNLVIEILVGVIWHQRKC